MQIHLTAIGDKMPAWVRTGYQEYAKRLPASCALRLIELPAARRGRSADAARLRRDEADRLSIACPKGAHRVALEVHGSAWSTAELATQLSCWMQSGRDLALLIGGPDGLDPALSESADQRWSLSPLTLPHPLVRVVLAEQIYRAWSLLQNHPYHRA